MPASRTPFQLPLEPDVIIDPRYRTHNKLVYSQIRSGHATFKAGLSAPVHRWFRLTPSFGPDLVREMLLTLECGTDDVVLDPFAGAGTTMIECQLSGISSVGFEINPFLQFVGQACLRWNIDPAKLEATFKDIQQCYLDLDSQVTFSTLDRFNLRIPTIHTPLRWWREDVLTRLLVLKRSIDSMTTSQPERDFFRLALAAVLVPDLTNVTLGRLQLHFIDRTNHHINVWETYSEHCQKMIGDVKSLRAQELQPTSNVLLVNSTDVGDMQLDRQPNCVITSPPYPNRYSYVWNTRPHLYLLDFVSEAKQSSAIDLLAIGGTWGTATSALLKPILQPEHQIVSEVVGPVISQIRAHDNLMANYALKYFNMLTKQILEMDRLLAKNARIAYVVGCSRLRGVYIETDVLLARIIEGLNLKYDVKAVQRIRRRNSGKDLHESIVYAWKRPSSSQ
jgi:tRNA G10  N-methylase Trm11